MKVLFISNDTTIFDSASVARARMRAYADMFGELHILSLSRAGVRVEHDGPLSLYPIHSWKLFHTHTLAEWIHKIILQKGIEIVSAQDPFEHGLAACKGVRGTKAKLHIQVHTDFLSPWFVRGSLRLALLNRYRRRIAERVLPSADGIRTVSKRVKASLVAHYGALIPEPSVIPITPDAVVPAPSSLPENSFRFTLIAVGRLEAEKRIEDILSALKIVNKTYSRIGLFIVGEGRELPKLRRRVHKLGLSEQVVFLGARTDARALMKSANAFIQASAYEGYGRTLIEAALAGVPIITTDVGIVGDVFVDDRDVLAVPVASPRALAHCISMLIGDNTLRLELSMKAKDAAQMHLAAQGDLVTRVVTDFASTRIGNSDLPKREV